MRTNGALEQNGGRYIIRRLASTRASYAGDVEFNSQTECLLSVVFHTFRCPSIKMLSWNLFEVFKHETCRVRDTSSIHQAIVIVNINTKLSVFVLW